jgi:hypothetical protein
VIADAGDAKSRVILSWDPALNTDNNHAKAAVAVCEKMGWVGEYYTPLVGGQYENEYYWVFTDTHST